MGKDKGFFRPRSSIDLFLYEELDWKELEREYQQKCCEVSLQEDGQPDWADLLAKQWTEEIRRMYREKDLPKEGFSTEIIKVTGRELSKAVNKGYSIIEGVEYDEIDLATREALKYNVWKFSVAKNHNDLIRLNNLLLRKDGSIRSWSEFKREAVFVVGQSNRYLKTEYDTIVAGAMMSSKWQDMQRNKHIFPYAQFKVVQDDRTSEICSPLHNIICKIDDPFLEHYFPPNHFNCRTDVIKLREATATPQQELPYLDIPKAFLNNAGATGEIFTEENFYIKNTPQKLLSDLDYYKKGEILISNKAKKFTTSENERPRVEREFENRIITANALQKHFKKQVKILPEIKPSHWSYEYHFDGIAETGKVPDLKVGMDYWEMESYEGKYKKSKLWHMIKEGAKQADFVALKLNEFVPLINIQNQMNILSNEKFNEMPLKVVIVNKEGKIIYEYKKERK